MEAIEHAPVVAICDAGPVIHLDEVHCLDLLDNFSRVVIPDTVWDEIHRHRPGALAHSTASIERASPIAPIPVELHALSKALPLHAGEVAALRIAIEIGDCILLTDDTAARLAARSLRIRAFGTLGMLLRAIRREQRTAIEISAIIRALPMQSTLHIKRDLLEKAIREIEGSP